MNQRQAKKIFRNYHWAIRNRQPEIRKSTRCRAAAKQNRAFTRSRRDYTWWRWGRWDPVVVPAKEFPR